MTQTKAYSYIVALCTVAVSTYVLYMIGAFTPKYQEIYNIEFLERKTDSFSISELDGTYYIGIDREGQPSKLLEGKTLVGVIAQAKAELK